MSGTTFDDNFEQRQSFRKDTVVREDERSLSGQIVHGDGHFQPVRLTVVNHLNIRL